MLKIYPYLQQTCHLYDIFPHNLYDPLSPKKDRSTGLTLCFFRKESNLAIQNPGSPFHYQPSFECPLDSRFRRKNVYHGIVTKI